MVYNYDSTNVGALYVRTNKIVIEYPENGIPNVEISQDIAVKLIDGTVAIVKPLHPIYFGLDLIGHGSDPIPLVDPTSGGSLGINTNLNQLFIGILAVIRQQQLIQNV